MASLTTPISISVQIDKEDKERATEILQKLGVSLKTKIKFILSKLVKKGRLPLTPKKVKN